MLVDRVPRYKGVTHHRVLGEAWTLGSARPQLGSDPLYLLVVCVGNDLQDNEGRTGFRRLNVMTSLARWAHRKPSRGLGFSCSYMTF